MIPGTAVFVPLQVADFLRELAPNGTRIFVFEVIFQWFMILGTLVGIVVISYMIWNAYKFRATGDEDKYADERPEMGEIPQGGGKGGKLFLSFGLSMLIVVSLIAWASGAVLFVEQPADQIAEDRGTEDPVEIRVEGYQFGWDFYYENYDTRSGELVIPADRPIQLRVTSRDVFHNFGIPEYRVKSDAIPGEITTTWFIAPEPGEVTAHCFELCGAGHSQMNAPVTVLSEDDWEDWKAENLEGNQSESVPGPDEESGDQRMTDLTDGVVSPAGTQVASEVA